MRPSANLLCSFRVCRVAEAVEWPLPNVTRLTTRYLSRTFRTEFSRYFESEAARSRTLFHFFRFVHSLPLHSPSRFPYKPPIPSLPSHSPSFQPPSRRFQPHPVPLYRFLFRIRWPKHTTLTRSIATPTTATMTPIVATMTQTITKKAPTTTTKSGRKSCAFSTIVFFFRSSVPFSFSFSEPGPISQARRPDNAGLLRPIEEAFHPHDPPPRAHRQR
jgi:hypothetical protein